MGIRYGSTTVPQFEGKLYYGGSKVLQAYYGSTGVWGAMPSASDTTSISNFSFSSHYTSGEHLFGDINRCVSDLAAFRVQYVVRFGGSSSTYRTYVIAYYSFINAGGSASGEVELFYTSAVGFGTMSLSGKSKTVSCGDTGYNLVCGLSGSIKSDTSASNTGDTLSFTNIKIWPYCTV